MLIQKHVCYVLKCHISIELENRFLINVSFLLLTQFHKRLKSKQLKLKSRNIITGCHCRSSHTLPQNSTKFIALFQWHQLQWQLIRFSRFRNWCSKKAQSASSVAFISTLARTRRWKFLRWLIAGTKMWMKSNSTARFFAPTNKYSYAFLTYFHCYWKMVMKKFYDVMLKPLKCQSQLLIESIFSWVTEFVPRHL